MFFFVYASLLASADSDGCDGGGLHSFRVSFFALFTTFKQSFWNQTTDCVYTDDIFDNMYLSHTYFLLSLFFQGILNPFISLVWYISPQ